MATKDVPTLTSDRWGRDHWSMLAQIGAATVNAEGLRVVDVVTLDKKGMRVNPNRHPQHFHRGNWRLRSGFKRGNEGYPVGSGSMIAGGERVRDHDDVDVLADLEREGFVIVKSWTRMTLRLTPRGQDLSDTLRAFLEAGGNVDEFRVPDPTEPPILDVVTP